MNKQLDAQSYGIGQPVRRVEDARFLTGRGRFVDDLELPHQAHAVVVLSPHAHARIRRIDTGAARAAPGVICVLTGVDVKEEGLGGLPPNFMPEDMGGPKGLRTRRPILVADRVRCVGDRVAFVVAETLAQARDAAERLVIDYEPLPAVARIEDAVKPGAPTVWDECPGNVSFTLANGDEKATAAAFANAAHVVSLRLRTIASRPTPWSRAPRSATTIWPTTATRSTPARRRRTRCARMWRRTCLDFPETTFRVIAPDVGGGFGVKADAYPEDALVLWASRRCGRPVHWMATRTNSIAGDNHARDQVVEAELALDASGKILAIRSHALHAVGAYIMSAAVAPLVYSLRYTPGVYDVQTLWLTTKAVFTHTTPLGVYRGAGRPEGNYVIERLLDRAAAVLGIGPDEIRRRNFIAPESDALHDADGLGLRQRRLRARDGQVHGARRLAELFQAPRRVEGERQAARTRGELLHRARRHLQRTMGMHFDPGGNATIIAGTHSHGQGHATAFAQLVSEWLGVPFEWIRYVQGDTDKVPFGRGTYAARSSVLGGSALRLAADAIIEKGEAHGGAPARSRRPMTSSSRTAISACAAPTAASRWSTRPRRSTRRSCRRASRSASKRAPVSTA